MCKSVTTLGGIKEFINYTYSEFHDQYCGKGTSEMLALVLLKATQ